MIVLASGINIMCEPIKDPHGVMMLGNGQCCNSSDIILTVIDARNN